MSLPITVLLALVFSAGLLGCDTAPESEATGNASVGTTPVLTEAPRIGHLAPDFVLTTLDRREVRRSDHSWPPRRGPSRADPPARGQPDPRRPPLARPARRGPEVQKAGVPAIVGEAPFPAVERSQHEVRRQVADPGRLGQNRRGTYARIPRGLAFRCSVAPEQPG